MVGMYTANEGKKESAVRCANHETDSQNMLPNGLENAVWPDFTGISKSPTRESRTDDLFSMLLMESDISKAQEESESYPVQSSDGVRSPVGTRSNYSRELLSVFLDQASGTEEEVLSYALKQPNLSPRAGKGGEPQRKKNGSKKKKHDGFPSHSRMNSGDEWSEWHETNKEIDTMLRSPMPSLSTSDTTPRSNNIVRAPVPSPVRDPSGTSLWSHAPSLGPQDAVSVNSDLSGLTGAFSDYHSTGTLQTITLPSHREEMELQAMAEKARLLSIEPRPVKPPKTVRFDKVQVRDYQRILDCNPSCTSGPPVGLGWKYAPERVYEFNLFESHREPYRRTHRGLVLPRETREELLKGLGYTEQDLAIAVRLSIKTRNKRKQTVNNLGAAKIEETIENAGRRVKSLFAGGKV